MVSSLLLVLVLLLFFHEGQPFVGGGVDCRLVIGIVGVGSRIVVLVVLCVLQQVLSSFQGGWILDDGAWCEQ